MWASMTSPARSRSASRSTFSGLRVLTLLDAVPLPLAAFAPHLMQNAAERGSPLPQRSHFLKEERAAVLGMSICSSQCGQTAPSCNVVPSSEASTAILLKQNGHRNLTASSDIELLLPARHPSEPGRTCTFHTWQLDTCQSRKIIGNLNCRVKEILRNGSGTRRGEDSPVGCSFWLTSFSFSTEQGGAGFPASLQSWYAAFVWSRRGRDRHCPRVRVAAPGLHQ